MFCVFFKLNSWSLSVSFFICVNVFMCMTLLILIMLGIDLILQCIFYNAQDQNHKKTLLWNHKTHFTTYGKKYNLLSKYTWKLLVKFLWLVFLTPHPIETSHQYCQLVVDHQFFFLRWKFMLLFTFQKEREIDYDESV
jgi:hypothetical protein